MILTEGNLVCWKIDYICLKHFKMSRKALYLISLIASPILLLIGALMIILHYPNSNYLILTGLLFSLIYLIIGIFEVLQSSTKPLIDKVFWILGFLICSWFVGLVFYFTNLKSNSKN